MKSYLHVINKQATKLTLAILFMILIVGCQERDSSSKTTFNSKTRKFKFKIYKVTKGDTFYSISKRFNTTIHEILLDNQLRTNKPLEQGKTLYIRTKEPRFQMPRRPVVYKSVRTQPPIRKTVYKPRKQHSIVRVKGNPPYMLIPRGTGYTKPLAGRIVRRYSNYEGGRPLYGVKIRSSKSQSVKSIHNGVVVFTAENFANFGRCVMIAHSRKEKCFYYGLDAISLKVGDVINKGYRIGKINNQKTLGLKILRNDYFVNPQKVVPRL